MTKTLTYKWTPNRDEVLKALGAVCETKYKRLQEQLKEANEVIADLSEYPPINTLTRELSFALNRYNAKKYLEKWGVK